MRNKKMRIKRILAVILTLCAVFSVASCSKISDEEMLTEYKALYEKALDVNRIIYGTGLPVDGEYDVKKLSSPYYVPVSESCPYKTLADVKNAVLSVYTEDYFNDVFKRVLFDGYEDKFAKINPRYKEIDGVLHTDITYEAFATVETGRVDLENATVKKNTGGGAEIVAPYYISGVRQKTDKTTVLIWTDQGLRFDTFA